uniref:Uncharacterized protein n=1 Tax=Glossina palpalis gambiensis TaxID=67801 RepID=A0A1B0BCY1_9MUSC
MLSAICNWMFKVYSNEISKPYSNNSLLVKKEILDNITKPLPPFVLFKIIIIMELAVGKKRAQFRRVKV